MKKSNLKTFVPKALVTTDLDAEKGQVPEEETNKIENNPAYLTMLLNRFQKEEGYAASRKVRAEGLLARKFASKWKPAKKAKVVRRFIVAEKEMVEANNAIDHIQQRLSTIEDNQNTTASGKL